MRQNHQSVKPRIVGKSQPYNRKSSEHAEWTHRLCSRSLLLPISCAHYRANHRRFRSQLPLVRWRPFPSDRAQDRVLTTGLWLRTMIVMLEFECWRASSNHDVRWLKVSRLSTEHSASACLLATADAHAKASLLVRATTTDANQRAVLWQMLGRNTPCDVIHQQSPSCATVV
eukprot:COSAG02_NODE_18923_length_910_cov_1.213317_1_plen_172_part_00